MSFLKKPFYVGNLKLRSNLFYAPLAGCSDLPYRRMGALQEFRPGLLFCEMVKMDALVRHDRKTYRLMDYTHDMHPIGAQICGSSPKLASTCAKVIEDLGFDLLDLNCGCPVDKVTKDGSGSGLLKKPQLIGEILHEMVRVVDIPVTLKIRAGWDEESIEVENITKIAEEAGAKVLTIHGRTRQQAYRGKANWDYIKRSKDVAKDILIFGNGDLFEPNDVECMFKHTSCDGVLVARGTMGNPRFSLELEEGKKEDPFKQLKQHLQYMELYQSEKRKMIELKKIAMWYLKDQPTFKELRKALCGQRDYEIAKSLLVKGEKL